MVTKKLCLTQISRHLMEGNCCYANFYRLRSKSRKARVAIGSHFMFLVKVDISRRERPLCQLYVLISSAHKIDGNLHFERSRTFQLNI